MIIEHSVPIFIRICHQSTSAMRTRPTVTEKQKGVKKMRIKCSISPTKHFIRIFSLFDLE